MRNLIALSGRAGSGKDTVGSIIQYLTAEDNSENCIKRVRGGLPIDGYHNSLFKIKKFAGKLKTIAALLSGANIEDFENQEFKKQRMTADWGMTYREFLQRLGTEAMREGLHEEVWVNALFADYKPRVTYQMEILDLGASDLQREKIGKPIHDEYPKWIITDMRFPNEMEAVKERNGITIRVVREHDIKIQHSGDPDDFHIEKFDSTNPKHVALKLAQSLNLHPSETALDDAEFDYVIENDGSIEELIKKVRDILIKEELL
jgi:hypothetical protein